ncbi:MAG: fimbrillin family protein [Paludibacteraceae bacterium]|nr:fimbrillin family protein [Paludibacteraceae bacterium]
MKKTLSIIALAALAFVGCTKVIPESPKTADSKEKDVPIEFNAYNYLSRTKAEGNTKFDESKSFEVWSYLSDGDFSASSSYLYFQDKVSFSNGKWAPANTYYWPKTGKLSFFAVYPTDVTGIALDTENNNLKITDYEVTASYAEQSATGAGNDLMLAEQKNQTSNISDNITYSTEGVSLLFKHQLAKVKFEGKLRNDNSYDSSSDAIKVGDIIFTAVIDEISLSGLNNTGTLALSGTSAAHAWTPKTDQTKVNSGKIVDMNYSRQLTNEFTLASALPAKEYKEFENEYYVLPQTLDDNAKITVKYTVYAINSGKVISKTVYDGAEGNHPAFTKKLNSFSQNSAKLTEWKINTIYDYKFILDPFEGNILFDPAVAPWDEVDAAEEYIHKDVDQ